MFLSCPSTPTRPSNPFCSPLDSTTWIPGSTTCLRCVLGVPKCVDGDCATPTAAASSPGNHILSLKDNARATCTNDGLGIKPALYGKCQMTDTTTKLSLLVAGDCSISIIPISDSECSEEGNDAYFSGMRIQAYYDHDLNTAGTADTYAIRSLLPASTSTAGSTSFLLSAQQSTTDTADLTVTTWTATTIAATATVSGTCALEMAIAGGQVALLPTAGPKTPCPPGSYFSEMDIVRDPTAIPYCMPW